MSNFTDRNRLHRILTTVLFLKLISSPLGLLPQEGPGARGGGESTVEAGAFLPSVASASKAPLDPGGGNLGVLEGYKAVVCKPEAQRGSSLPWSESVDQGRLPQSTGGACLLSTKTC